MTIPQAMDTLLAEQGVRAVHYAATQFEAFRIATDIGRTIPLATLFGGTLEEALNATLAGTQAIYHKDCLLIRETGEQGVKLHLYAIKRKSTPRWVHKDHVTRAVHDLYAAPVCTIDEAVISNTQEEADVLDKQSGGDR